MKKSIPEKTPKERVFEKSGSGSGDSGLRGFLAGGSEPITLPEKNGLGWIEMGVYFQPPDGQKVNSGLMEMLICVDHVSFRLLPFSW